MPAIFAVSLHIYQMGAPPLGADNVPVTGTLADAAGNTIPTRLVWTQNDPNGQIRDRNNYFLIPLQPLAANATYQARLAGLDNSFNKIRPDLDFYDWGELGRGKASSRSRGQQKRTPNRPRRLVEG